MESVVILSVVVADVKQLEKWLGQILESVKYVSGWKMKMTLNFCFYFVFFEQLQWKEQLVGNCAAKRMDK